MLTKEGQAAGAALWDRYQKADLKDSEALDLLAEKIAGDLVESGIFYEGRPRPGFAFQAGDFELRIPKTAEEANEGILKLASFWGDAFQNLGRTLQNVVRGGGQAAKQIEWKDLSRFVNTQAHKVNVKGMKAFVDSAATAVSETGMTGYQKAQAGLAGALVAVPLAAGAAEAHDAYKKHQYAVVLDQIMKDPAFENVTDASKVKDAYHMMMKYSPSIAMDPLVSKSFVTFLVTHPDMAGLAAAQSLMEAENKFKESGEFASAFSDRVRRLMRHPLAEPFMGGGGGGGGGKKK